MAGDTDLAAQKARLVEDFDKIVGDTEALLRSLANVSGEKAAGDARGGGSQPHHRQGTPARAPG
jgi:hypothetical protein